jgi:hypothetical protein
LHSSSRLRASSSLALAVLNSSWKGNTIQS